MYGEDLVMLTCPAAGITGTSNTTACTLTGLPEDLKPSIDVVLPATILNNTYNCPCLVFLQNRTTNPSGTIQFFVQLVSDPRVLDPGAFVNSGLKGLNGGWQMLYRLRRND